MGDHHDRVQDPDERADACVTVEFYVTDDGTWHATMREEDTIGWGATPEAALEAFARNAQEASDG